jgi:phosphomannomutase
LAGNVNLYGEKSAKLRQPWQKKANFGAPSGTEPLIRVMVEAETLELANFWTERLVEAVRSYLL